MSIDYVQKIISQIVGELAKSETIGALVLAGSQVKGNTFPADDFSDIELYVVAFDEKFSEAEKQVQSVQTIFGDEVVLAYQNQWAGWSILFKNLLRLELPLVKASDEKVFSLSPDQKIDILYTKPNFTLKRGKPEMPETGEFYQEEINQKIKDFWYMAVYAAQHIGRGEFWLARNAIRISMQGKVKKFLNKTSDKRLEISWTKKI